MKRTIPLLITALSGFILIFAYFIPATQSWGEIVSIWFDILAAIAFVLGGGNLLKVQLKKISDRKAGWGFAAVTVVAFFVTLLVGLFKLGVPPASQQEFQGESFARLPIAALPVFSVPGVLPEKAQHRLLPASVRAQFRAADGQLIFQGWMRPGQLQDLLEFDSRLEWQCAVERLAAAAVPPPQLIGALNYYYEHESLAFRAWMSPDQAAALRTAVPNPAAAPAIEQLVTAARRETNVAVQSVPENLEIPEPVQAWLRLENQRLTIRGPLDPLTQQQLTRSWAKFPIARRLDDFQQVRLLTEISAASRPLSQEQVVTLNRVLSSSWTAGELRDELNAAGQAQPSRKSACDLLAERNSGVTDLDPTRPAGDSVTVNDAQLAELERYAVDPEFTVDALFAALRAAGPLTSLQASRLQLKLNELPTEGERKHQLAIDLLKVGPLSRSQIDSLLSDYRDERRWRRDVAHLAAASHVVKYPWSGEYGQQGSGFNWIYEYIFKPLTATMFALLAFYVASAAFRAFRAKNFEAILLLGTAFIILLGRTFAGVLLTSWLPDSLSTFRVENLTVEIMSVFNTAGSRAIMIGIALGLAATSLRVLLGIDRSHLGGGDD